MNEFKDKFNSSELVWNAIAEIDKDQASAGLLIDVIRSEFKDWQPPKQLLVVPRIVADFIKDKKGNLTLYGALREMDERNDAELSNWVFEKSDGQSLFARAWIDGYRVEKPEEKLYFVKLPGMRADLAYLCKSCSPGELGYLEKYSSKEPNKISFSSRYDKKYYGGWQRQFTEPEVKAIDERFWAFAVPVEDEEMK